MPNPLPLVYNFEASAQGGKGIVRVRRVALPIEQVRDWNQRLAHGMPRIAFGDLLMAIDALRVADIADVGIDVPVGPGVSPPWIGQFRRRIRRRPWLRRSVAACQPDAAEDQASDEDQASRQQDRAPRVGSLHCRTFP